MTITPDPKDIQAWMREEAIKREREVQKAQALAREQDEAGEGHGIAGDIIGDAEDFIREHAGASDTQQAIRETCDALRDMLLEKNAQYGDSAINPVRVFSKADPAEQLLVRLDDKLSRIARGDDRLESDEDVLNDIIGYLILYKIAKRANS